MPASSARGYQGQARNSCVHSGCVCVCACAYIVYLYVVAYVRAARAPPSQRALVAKYWGARSALNGVLSSLISTTLEMEVKEVKVLRFENSFCTHALTRAYKLAH
jgi:hypothetical protein